MATGFSQKRRFAATALIACACLTSGATLADNTSDAAMRADRSAYQATMKCFVAGGIAVGDARDAGQTQKMEAFDVNARKSFDAAKKLGALLGYSGDRIEQDFSLAQTYELPRMTKDIVYYREAVATCKALGLM